LNLENKAKAGAVVFNEKDVAAYVHVALVFDRVRTEQSL